MHPDFIPRSVETRIAPRATNASASVSTLPSRRSWRELACCHSCDEGTSFQQEAEAFRDLFLRTL